MAVQRPSNRRNHRIIYLGSFEAIDVILQTSDRAGEIRQQTVVRGVPRGWSERATFPQRHVQKGDGVQQGGPLPRRALLQRISEHVGVQPLHRGLHTAWRVVHKPRRRLKPNQHVIMFIIYTTTTIVTLHNTYR